MHRFGIHVHESIFSLGLYIAIDIVFIVHECTKIQVSLAIHCMIGFCRFQVLLAVWEVACHFQERDRLVEVVVEKHTSLETGCKNSAISQE